MKSWFRVLESLGNAKANDVQHLPISLVLLQSEAEATLRAKLTALHDPS
jgi:hypothetical protein